MSDNHAVWLRIVADHGDVNEKQQERLRAAADRITELEAELLRSNLGWSDAADRIEELEDLIATGQCCAGTQDRALRDNHE